MDKGNPDSINPDIPIDEQPELLLYRWEFPRDRFKLAGINILKIIIVIFINISSFNQVFPPLIEFYKNFKKSILFINTEFQIYYSFSEFKKY